MGWQPGDTVVLREIWNGRVFEARPAIVVQDDPHQLMYFIPGYVGCGLPIGDDGNELRLPDRPWRLEVRPRGPLPALSFAWPGTPYAVLLWSVDHETRVWYVNLQTPLVRTTIGFDTTDHALDVLVALDRSSWRWKDEDELAEAVAMGLFTAEDAAWFRHWGERGIEHIMYALPPFDVDWTSWAPDPSWSSPQLLPGWDVV